MNRSRFLVSAEDETQVDITPMLEWSSLCSFFYCYIHVCSGMDVTRPDAETAVKTDALTIQIGITANNQIV